MIRVARYLLKYPKLVRKYDRGEWSENDIDVLSDSQWAAFPRSRRSTSGCVIVVDGRTVKHWSSTQATIAMPLGEAEYYVMVKFGAEVGVESRFGVRIPTAHLGGQFCR